jgi:hypothetical protein
MPKDASHVPSPHRAPSPLTVLRDRPRISPLQLVLVLRVRWAINCVFRSKSERAGILIGSEDFGCSVLREWEKSSCSKPKTPFCDLAHKERLCRLVGNEGSCRRWAGSGRMSSVTKDGVGTLGGSQALRLSGSGYRPRLWARKNSV